MWHDRVAGRSHAGEEKRGVWHDMVAGKGYAGEEKMGMWHDRVAGKGHAGEEKRDVWHDSCRLATPETGKKARVPGCGAARKRR